MPQVVRQAGYQILPQIGNKTLMSVFSVFSLEELKNDLKSPILVQFGSNLAHFNHKPDTPEDKWLLLL